MAKKTIWSIKGVDEESRAVARAAAARAGLPIGAWIDRAILKAAAAAASPGEPSALAADPAPAGPVPPSDPSPPPTPSSVDAAAALARPEPGGGTGMPGETVSEPPRKSPLDGAPPRDYRLHVAPAPPRRRPVLRYYGLAGAAVLAVASGIVWIWDRAANAPAPPPSVAVPAATASRDAAPAERAGPAGPPAAAASEPLAEGKRPAATSPSEGASASAPARLAALADAGNMEAQYELGLRYSRGDGVAKDDRLAAEWFEKAATHGLADAQYQLGLLYEQGRGVPQDDKLAFFWYQSAAEQGHARAQHNLATLYAMGRGIAQNYREAGRWFERAAKAGIPDSLYTLGLMHEHGLGVARDRAAAMDYYSRAAATGHAEAGGKLAELRREAPSPPPAPRGGKDEDAAADRPLTRAEVAELQRLLTRLDFAPGSADGVAGRRTVTAIRLYQEFAGLPVDGRPTLQLLDEIRAVTGSLAGARVAPRR